jgi:hypothetical protein
MEDYDEEFVDPRTDEESVNLLKEEKYGHSHGHKLKKHKSHSEKHNHKPKNEDMDL